MNTVAAKIISVSGRSATVNVETVPVCARCAAGKGCGAGLLGAGPGETTITVPLPKSGAFFEGDSVQLGIPSSRLLRASLLIYGLPLAGAIIFTAFGWLFFRPISDATGVILAVTGLAIGFLAGRRQLQKKSCIRQFQPEIFAGSTVQGPLN